jgi:hypothetical protein
MKRPFITLSRLELAEPDDAQDRANPTHARILLCELSS